MKTLEQFKQRLKSEYQEDARAKEEYQARREMWANTATRTMHDLTIALADRASDLAKRVIGSKLEDRRGMIKLYWEATKDPEISVTKLTHESLSIFSSQGREIYVNPKSRSLISYDFFREPLEEGIDVSFSPFRTIGEKMTGKSFLDSPKTTLDSLLMKQCEREMQEFLGPRTEGSYRARFMSSVIHSAAYSYQFRRKMDKILTFPIGPLIIEENQGFVIEPLRIKRETTEEQFRTFLERMKNDYEKFANVGMHSFESKFDSNLARALGNIKEALDSAKYKKRKTQKETREIPCVTSGRPWPNKLLYGEMAGPF